MCKDIHHVHIRLHKCYPEIRKSSTVAQDGGIRMTPYEEYQRQKRRERLAACEKAHAWMMRKLEEMLREAKEEGIELDYIGEPLRNSYCEDSDGFVCLSTNKDAECGEGFAWNISIDVCK